MSGVSWYKRFPADFLHSTAGLSCEEKGAYSVLLDLMYERGGPIADDPAWIARMCGCSQRKWTQVLRPRLIDLGKINVVNGHLSNGRMLYETHAAAARIKAATDARQKAKKPIIDPINQGEPCNVNDLASTAKSECKSVRPKPNIAPINRDELCKTNNLASTALIPHETGESAPDPVDNLPESRLSPIYPPDKSEINETQVNENNDLTLQDSGLSKRSKKGSSSLRSLRTHATPLPGDWQPSPEERDYASAHGVDPDRAAEEFVNHWSNVSGAAGLKSNWSATFRNRILWLQDRGTFLIRKPAEAARPKFRNGFLQLIHDEGMPSQRSVPPADPVSAFLARYPSVAN